MAFLRVVGILLVGMLVIILVGPFLIPVPPAPGTRPVEQLADPDSRFISVNGITLHYKQAGQGQPAIILLHGFGASTFSWREVTEPLSQQGTLIAFDRPAFGLTERPTTWSGQNPYSPEAQVELLFGLLDSLKIERAILVGNSAGGAVAINAALARSDRVQALVLVDAAVYSGGPNSPLMRLLFQTPQANHLGPLLVRSIATRGMNILTEAWHDPTRITPTITEGYRKPLQAENWDGALWQLTRASHDLGLPERLTELNLPVLVVTGDDDRIVPTENSVRLAKEIRGAKLAVFKNCGHVPHEECSADFLAVVQPFIEEVIARK